MSWVEPSCVSHSGRHMSPFQHLSRLLKRLLVPPSGGFMAHLHVFTDCRRIIRQLMFTVHYDAMCAKMSKGAISFFWRQTTCKVTGLLQLYQLMQQYRAHFTNLFIRVCKCRCCLLFVMLNMHFKPTVNTKKQINNTLLVFSSQVKTHKHTPTLTNNQRGKMKESERERQRYIYWN